ncbi:DNA-directed DNA polymerase alpha subunit pol12 [Linderina macrospora]|uniref:DNA-directed DNA polymerase alpha subunit pol12 n=1 Tax=Linderina macrospora TaxID=4868 RepID=A0ACC1J859_9FUNG|nr:DNA-directed DNA polymerase alpha subunit pol12 [Linderina macrospora]
MTAPTVAELTKLFQSAKLDSDALTEAQSICETFGQTASELFFRWQSVLINTYNGDTSIQPTRERLLELRHTMQREHDRKAASQRHGITGSPATPGNRISRNKNRTTHYDMSSVGGLMQDMVNGSQRSVMSTPQSTKRVGLLRGNASTAKRPGMFSSMSPGTEASPMAARFRDRMNAGESVNSVNSELPELKLDAIANRQLSIEVVEPDSAKTAAEYADDMDEDGEDEEGSQGLSRQRMRYMFEKPGTRSDVLNRRIERMASDVKAEYKIDALANPTYAHQDLVTSVGRIVGFNPDDPGANGHLTNDTVYLETSRRLGNGRRVQLDISSTASFSLFPGQVVAAEGKNLDGSVFAVSQFRPLPLQPHQGTDKRASGVTPFSATVASGPFTLSDNFDYEPLAVLVDCIVKNPPSAVFLLGPFVSETHPLIKEGMVDMMPEQIFAAHIVPLLKTLRDGVPAETAVFLVPSPDEMCHPFASYPQPPLNRDLMARLGVPSGIQFLDNPAQLIINGVSIAVANTETLLYLNSSEISRMPSLVERLPRMAWHMATQRHFFPLTPAPENYAGILVSHDVKLRMHVMPDILITPSKLRHFVHAHKNVVLVNPGHSTLGQGGGTYAKVYVHDKAAAAQTVQLNSLMGDDDEEVFPAHCIRAEIVRL